MDFGNKRYSTIADLANDLSVAANRAYFSPELYPGQKAVVASILASLDAHLKALPD